MTETEFDNLITCCRQLNNDQKVQLIRALLGGDRTIELKLPNEEEKVLSISTASVSKLLNAVADTLAAKGGDRLRFELYKEIAA